MGYYDNGDSGYSSSGNRVKAKLGGQFGNQISANTDDLKESVNAYGLFEPGDIKEFELFNTHGYLNPYDMMGTTFEYVFFTKPDLYITDGGSCAKHCKQPIFTNGLRQWPSVLDNLQLQRDQGKPFNALLYNRRTSNLDLPDLEGGDIETSENMWGTKTHYRRSSITTNDSYDFSMEFWDDRRLSAYMFFRLYDEYETRKSYGLVNLHENSYYLKYVTDKRLHDQFAIFKFILGEDCRTIVHWSKLYGVYPKNVPRNAFSDMPADGIFKFTVQFKANWVDDMDPMILTEFNNLSSKYGGFSEKQQYSDEGFYRSAFGKPPYISSARGDRGLKYIMLWRD
jgi:hypothetical protein